MNIFRPNKFRYFSWFLMWSVLGSFFVSAALFLLYRIPNLAYILFFTIGATVGGSIGVLIVLEQTMTRAQIVITNETISGPTVWGNRRVQFPLSDLDKDKSSKPNFFQHILGYRLIQSKTGQKIMFTERVFDKNQVADILKKIGCADSLAA